MPTAIHEIHGNIPLDEHSSRGLNSAVSGFGYVPYLSMTRGEMKLALLSKQAEILSKSFPEYKEYSRAKTLLENALNSGISRGVSFVGDLNSAVLQQVAREIKAASKDQRPASKSGIFGRKSIGNGIGEIPVSDRLKACVESAKGNTFKILKCVQNSNIEKILNGGILDSSHHILYKDMKGSDSLTQLVTAKSLNHRLGVEGLAASGEIEKSLMNLWVETAIIEKNTIKGAGVRGSRDSTLLLRDTKQEKIGVIDPVTASVIIAICAGAFGTANELLKTLRSQKGYAMTEVKGYGTEAFGPQNDDWLGDDSTNSALSSNTLLIGGAALAAYFLLIDK